MPSNQLQPEEPEGGIELTTIPSITRVGEPNGLAITKLKGQLLNDDMFGMVDSAPDQKNKIIYYM